MPAVENAWLNYNAHTETYPCSIALVGSCPTAPLRIYVVGDNQLLSEAYAFMLQAHDFVTECFITGGSFLASRWQPENAALLLDLCLPDMGGLEILAAVRMQAPTMPGDCGQQFGDVSTAVQAMKQGAVDFIENRSMKPS